MKKALALCLALLTTACATTPQPVAIPVCLPRELPAKPPKPALPLETLREGTTAQVLDAYAQSLARCVRYTTALEIYLEGTK